MKLNNLFEASDYDTVNTVITLLQQGKACYRYMDLENELSLSVWTDIPETITEQQLDQLLKLCDFSIDDFEMALMHIPLNIENVIEDKTRILAILNNNRSYNKSLRSAVLVVSGSLYDNLTNRIN